MLDFDMADEFDFDNFISLEDITRSTSRIPFVEKEMRVLLDFIKYNRSKGLMTGIHPIMIESVQEFVDSGVVVIPMDDLATSVVYVKIDAGRGFFGGQKALYGSYVGSIMDDALTPGATFKSWGIAITSINNIYRNLDML